MTQKLSLTLFTWFCLLIPVFGQSPDCTAFNQPAPLADSCSNAVFLCGNYLEGYCSSNAGLTPDTIGSWTFQNSGFLRLSPCDDTLILSVVTRNCSDPGGLHVSLFSGDCDNLTLIDDYQVVDNDSVPLLFLNLNPNLVYFLAVDGAVCEFSIYVNQGMGTAAPGFDGNWDCADGSIDGPPVICPGDIATYTIIPPVCVFTPGTPVGGNMIYCPPPPEIGCPAADSLDLVWHIPEALMFVGDSTGFTIQVMIDTPKTWIDTLIMDSIWVEWKLVATTPPLVDTLTFCNCEGASGPRGVIKPFHVIIKHETFFEYCELTCDEPFCEINGVIYDQPGTYVTDPDNCTTLIVVIEENFNLPFINLAATSASICAGEEVDLVVINPNPNLIYFWNNGLSGPNLTVSPGATTTYTVTGLDPFSGCQSQESITITVNQFEIINMGQVAVLNCDEPCVDVYGQTYCAPGQYSVEISPCLRRDFSIGFEKNVQNLGVAATLTCNQPCYETQGQIFCSSGNFSVEDDCNIYEFVLEQDTDAPITGDPVHQCLPSNAMFTVSFSIQAQGAVKVDGSPFSGAYFLSAPMPNGTNYAFVVEQESNGCATVVSGTYDCAAICGNDGGMLATAPLTGCIGDLVHPEVLLPAMAVPGDTVLFALHTTPDLQQGTVLAINNTGAFDFDPQTMSPGQQYYISQIAGPVLPGGQPDFDNPCMMISSSQAVTFFANPEIESVQIQSPSCFGLNDGSLAIQEINGTPPLNYALDNSGFSNNSSFENLSPGSYLLQVSDANGCSADMMVSLEQPDSLWLDIGTSQTIQVGESVVLQANTNADPPFSTYWESDQGDIQDGGEEWTVSPGVPTLYNCIVTNSNGCTAQASMLIEVEGAFVFYPNVVLMNANNPDNGYFTLFAPDRYIHAIRELAIYNRWGEQIFERSDIPPNQPTEGWNGQTPNGAECPQDVYLFVARVELYNGQEEVYKGDVTLIR